MLCTMVQKDWFWKTLEVPAKKKKKSNCESRSSSCKGYKTNQCTTGTSEQHLLCASGVPSLNMCRRNEKNMGWKKILKIIKKRMGQVNIEGRTIS